jgi:tRNA(Ile)-lysidine synthase
VTKPSLRTVVRRALEGETKLAPGTCVLVAVSGGPDTMALLDVMADLSAAFGLRLLAHGVDHGLRTAAASELDLAERHGQARGVSFGRTRASVTPGGNLQERARQARWSALAEAARAAGAKVIATAHHADDRAETVLIRLLQGSTSRGLGAMPARDRASGAPDMEVIRPLLRARKTDVLAHVERRRVPHAVDPSNDDARFLRARVRRELLPLLCDLSPGIVDHLVALADELAADRGASGRPDEHIGDAGQPTTRDWAAGLPRRTREALRALERSRSPSARVWLPGGLVAMVDQNHGGRARSRQN